MGIGVNSVRLVYSAVAAEHREINRPKMTTLFPTCVVIASIASHTASLLWNDEPSSSVAFGRPSLAL